MENNLGGVSITALEKASGSSTIYKTTGSGPAPHPTAEKALSLQVSETSTRS